MGQTRSLLLHAVTLLPVSRYSPRMRFTSWNPQEANMWALLALGASGDVGNGGGNGGGRLGPG